MKTIKKQFRIIAVALSILVFFQGCTVYKSVGITLDEAVQNESQVLIRTKDNGKHKYKRIGVENGQYYGVKKVKGEIFKVPLDENGLEKIEEKNKTMSTILSIGLPLTIITVPLLFNNKSKGDNWDIEWPPLYMP